MSYVEDLFGLKGTVAVVTGGAGVLPKAMATTLAKAGASVCIWGRGTSHPVQEAVDDIKREIDAAGGGGTVVGETIDTADEPGVERALESTTAAIGMPNLLINGVGGNKGKSAFVDIDLKLFGEVLEMNLFGGLIVPSKVFTRRWMDSGVTAGIINVASMTSYVPLSGVWAYTAAKSAVLKLTEGMANEFAPAGIRVNAVAPGFFVGNQNRRLLIKNDDTGELTERGRQIIDRTPFERFGEIGDLEGTTVFLASPQASGFLTGVCIPVDGGYLIDNI
jgi:NAD(P)-dependent dehydrogenase (short-subunit alcohol dehydrogenase family)